MTAPLVHYFSPMPPVRSGIADYSRDLLPAIERRMNVMLAESAAEPTPAGTLPLYQMGNNIHHEEIYRRAVEEPGLTVLHDYVLHHLLGEMTLSRGDEAGYAAAIGYHHGGAGIATARARNAGVFGDLQQFILEANGELLDRSFAAIVHSEDAARRIRERRPDYPVHVVPMGVPPAVLPSREEARERLGIRPDAFLCASFGFITPIKCIDLVIRAMARVRREMPGAELCLVGEVSPYVPVEDLIAQHDLHGAVRVAGFVDQAAWNDYVAAVDVCLNLRYPTAGETSASLIKLLAAGKTVLVPRYRQFAEIPRDAAVFVDLSDREEELVYRYLVELGQNPELRRRIGLAAKEYAESHHTLDAAAAGYEAAILDALRNIDERRLAVESRTGASADWPRQSRVPGIMKGTIEASSRMKARQGSSVRFAPRVRNLGDTIFLANPGTGGDRNYVVLDVRLRQSQSKASRRGWYDLPADLLPGKSCLVPVTLQLPNEVGPWEIRLTLRNVGFGKFSEHRRVRLSEQ